MVKAEMRPAYQWTCDKCGRENFESCIVAELSEEDRECMKQDYGVQPWEHGDFVTYPDSVTCIHCGRTYQTEQFGGDDNA